MFKATFCNLIAAIAAIFQGAEAHKINSNESLNRNFIEKVFKEVIEDLNADEKIISHYFSPHYIQHVDGQTFNYHDFVQHMRAQKSLLESIKVCIEHCVIEGNSICTVHRVDAIKKNGKKIAIKVIAYFVVENKKIMLCDELTRLLEGDATSQNIGSVK